jgi:hypothetical protein
MVERVLASSTTPIEAAGRDHSTCSSEINSAESGLKKRRAQMADCQKTGLSGGTAGLVMVI